MDKEECQVKLPWEQGSVTEIHGCGVLTENVEGEMHLRESIAKGNQKGVSMED